MISFLQAFRLKVIFLVCPMHTTCYTHLNLFLIALVIFYEEYTNYKRYYQDLHIKLE
jgi:hypothetical protein